MIELLSANLWLIVIALVIGILVAWWIFVANRKTRVITKRPDVMDEGAAPAKRNQALIDAPSAAEKPGSVLGTPPIAQPKPELVPAPAPKAPPVAKAPPPKAAPQPKAAPKPPAAATKAQPKPTPKAAPKVTAKGAPAVKVASKPVATPKVAPKAAPKAKVAPKPAAAPAAAPKVKAAPKPAPAKPKATPKAKEAPKTAAVPKAAPKPKPAPGPAAKPKAAPKPTAAAKPKPAAKLSAGPDELIKIKGLGPKLQQRFKELGVTSFAQIAAWTAADIDRIDSQLGAFTGRIERDAFVEQAKLLAAGNIAGFEAKFGAL